MTSFPQPKSISGPLSDSLAFYVYLLVDPRDGKVFYVGKGKGGRCFDHSASDDGVAKASKIAEIEAAGLTPNIDIIRHGLENEAEAFLVESAVIDAFGLGNLTNIAPGHGVEKFGRTSLAELAARYMPEEAEVIHKVIFLKIAQTYRKGMSAQELYEAARGVWNFNRLTPRSTTTLSWSIKVWSLRSSGPTTGSPQTRPITRRARISPLTPSRGPASSRGSRPIRRYAPTI